MRYIDIHDPATKLILEHKEAAKKASEEKKAEANSLFEQHKVLHDKAKAAADKAKEYDIEFRSCERLLSTLNVTNFEHY